MPTRAPSHRNLRGQTIALAPWKSGASSVFGRSGPTSRTRKTELTPIPRTGSRGTYHVTVHSRGRSRPPPVRSDRALEKQDRGSDDAAPRHWHRRRGTSTSREPDSPEASGRPPAHDSTVSRMRRFARQTARPFDPSRPEGGRDPRRRRRCLVGRQPGHDMIDRAREWCWESSWRDADRIIRSKSRPARNFNPGLTPDAHSGRPAA
jgi:hypothetical protein